MTSASVMRDGTYEELVFAKGWHLCDSLRLGDSVEKRLRWTRLLKSRKVSVLRLLVRGYDISEASGWLHGGATGRHVYNIQPSPSPSSLLALPGFSTGLAGS